MRRSIAALALGVLLLVVGGADAHAATTTPQTTAAASTASPVYAYYYLWWSTKHWHDKLGSSYPYSASPLPLPATLDAYGCNARSLYAGNQLTDVPAALFTQDDATVIERDVRQAAAAGLRGFIVNWRGTGSALQTVDSVSYSRRLQYMFDAVHKVNAEGIPFKLWLVYKASDTLLTTTAIANDLAYLQRMYVSDPALDRTYSARPMLIWGGSRKYALSTIQTISRQFRPAFFLLGDENWKTWGDGRAASLDGDQYYWSSQNPYTNPGSFDQIKSLAAMVRGSGPNQDGSPKLWFAPLTPGYNGQLLTGSTSCVPRNGGQTMQLIHQGNAASNPDGWTFISWNEIAEGTYIQPLQRYGSFYLDELGRIATG